jgi:hypothetical protein
MFDPAISEAVSDDGAALVDSQPAGKWRYRPARRSSQAPEALFRNEKRSRVAINLEHERRLRARKVDSVDVVASADALDESCQLNRIEV